MAKIVQLEEMFLVDDVPSYLGEDGEFHPLPGGGVDLGPILSRLTDYEADLSALETTVAALQAGTGGVEEWVDVTPHFHLEYRSEPGVDVWLGQSSAAYQPGSVISVGYFRTRTAFWVDAYVRFGDGCTAYKNSLTEGQQKNGWDLVCYDRTLWPLGFTGGYGLCQIHSADPHEGDNTTGAAHWEPKPSGRWAIVPTSTPLGVSGGNFTWWWPEVSGHAVWEFAGSFFRIVMGPCRRRI